MRYPRRHHREARKKGLGVACGVDLERENGDIRHDQARVGQRQPMRRLAIT
jgi:hypothetical protein